MIGQFKKIYAYLKRFPLQNQGIPDERLPKELVLAKEHFLELRGWNYDDATVVI